MKNLLASLTALLVAAFAVCHAAEATNRTTSVRPATSARGGRNSANSNDVFYTLGPDSMPREGVPKGKFTEAKVIPSNIFPGTQHTYWVYVPAQ